jgi:two-component system chemotaxis response regulator CheY
MHILLVDDSRAMRRILRSTLRAAGFGANQISEAVNGEMALESIKTTAPDVVLSDWCMPCMTGIELLEALNHEGIKTKFGFVTAESSNEMRKRASDAGARFMLGKPFTPESFHSALEPVLQA